MTPAPDLTLGTAVDWRFAATVGRRLARPGPPSTDYTRRQVIDELAGAATKAEPLVRQVTGLLTDGADDGRVPAARIVDRPEWIAAAAESMRVMMNGTERPRGFLTGRVTGAQTGAVLAYVSSGILGQYDPFATDRGAGAGSTASRSGSGLGLALVAQQAELHGGTAELQNSPLGGTRLLLRLAGDGRGPA
ncbi:zinc-dependent metalloprotease [Mycobacterium avium subsp. avium]|nr:Sensor-type histidine kinase PrrB [Mycobacterium avium subsp. avium]UEA19426.1 zinc-dependent metalloprotease [Mycobacterium avium subsp. avium]